MADDDGDDLMPRFEDELPIAVSSAAPRSSKPSGSVRLLVFLLQTLVMAFVLALFVLFTGVAAILLVQLLVVGRAVHRRRRHLDALALISAAAAHGPALSPDNLRLLPCFDFPGIQQLPESPDCAVCLEGFGVGDRCRALPGCRHVFHVLCVDRWLVRAPVCPICRTPVAIAGPKPTVEQPVG